MKSCLLVCLLSVVFMVPGCRSTGNTAPTVASALAASDAAELNGKPITFVDRVELQAGTGRMDSDIAPEFLSTDSGLRYRVLRNSELKKPTAASKVSVNYRGWLDNGKEFDSSYKRGKPTSFPLNGVIAGWTEGMQLVGQGGMIELWVPSRLGYGERGAPGSIPPHSNLHFIVELVSVD